MRGNLCLCLVIAVGQWAWRNDNSFVVGSGFLTETESNSDISRPIILDRSNQRTTCRFTLGVRRFLFLLWKLWAFASLLLLECVFCFFFCTGLWDCQQSLFKSWLTNTQKKIKEVLSKIWNGFGMDRSSLCWTCWLHSISCSNFFNCSHNPSIWVSRNHWFYANESSEII